MESSGLPYIPRDWKEFGIKAVINLHRNNGERELLYGPLGSLPVHQVEFLEKMSIVTPYEDDFYIWMNKDSLAKWKTFKELTVSKLCTYVMELRKDDKGKEREVKVYNNLFRMNNSDIIGTSLKGKEMFMKKYPTSGEQIEAITPTADERKIIVPMYKQFDNMLLAFYKANDIPASLYDFV